jgi:CRISPR type III-B/RAMP module RAMP protein Cmr6
MPDACREKISELWEVNLLGASNATLIKDRYLNVAVKDDTQSHSEARTRLYNAMRQALHLSTYAYKNAFERNKSSIGESKAGGNFRTINRMVIGLGNENVLETGLTLHRIYGTPIIPGSALKGLASHYCDQVWGEKDSDYKKNKQHHTVIFGTSEDSGHIIFHDAWITPETMANSLHDDVMTPHHSDYYSSNNDIPPTDFDKPIPVTFLSIVGDFHIMVSCDVSGEQGQAWADRVFELLSEALKEWGIGGKTSSGYGRMEREQEMTTAGIAPARPRAAQRPREPRHRKGEIIDVTRVEDPKGRNRLYFVDEDGFGGTVRSEELSRVKIGQSTRLKITGVQPPEGYAFAVLDSIPPSQVKRQGDQRR